MPTIETGRCTHDPARGADLAGELVVFVIGMRINKPWRPDAWLPAATAMGRMVGELTREADSALLGFRVILTGRGPASIQYWRDQESLYRYAGAPDAEHRPAWAAFNRRIRRVPGAVGIYHETFRVAAAESIYVDMPPSGLAKALGVVPVGRRADRAEDRMRAAAGTG